MKQQTREFKPGDRVVYFPIRRPIDQRGEHGVITTMPGGNSLAFVKFDGRTGDTNPCCRLEDLMHEDLHHASDNNWQRDDPTVSAALDANTRPAKLDAAPRILVVEDDPRIMDVLVDAIEASVSGIKPEITQCTSVGCAITALETNPQFDAIVLDMGLPMKPGRGAGPREGSRIWMGVRRGEWREGLRATPIVINTGLDYGDVAEMIDANTRYSNKNTPVVVRHLQEVLHWRGPGAYATKSWHPSCGHDAMEPEGGGC